MIIWLKNTAVKSFPAVSQLFSTIFVLTLHLSGQLCQFCAVNRIDIYSQFAGSTATTEEGYSTTQSHKVALHLLPTSMKLNIHNVGRINWVMF